MITFDHPGWVASDVSGRYRVVRRGTSTWLVRGDVTDIPSSATDAMPSGAPTRLTGRSSQSPVFDAFDPATITAHTRLTGPLRRAGRVHRLRNPDLWDALANAIIRQVIRAGDARKMYQRFSREHGHRVDTALGVAFLIPEPGVVLGLSDRAFTNLGMAFKMPVLRAAAHAYLADERRWSRLDSCQLFSALQAIPRIGPWTAGAAVADYTNDYSLYPFSDLAVRTWGAKLAPSLNLPTDEGEFAKRWRALANGHLAELTMLTLAWGSRHVA